MKIGIKFIVLSSVFATGLVLGGATLNAQDLHYDRELWPLENAYIEAGMNGDLEKRASFWHPGILDWHSEEDRPWDKRYAAQSTNPWYGAGEGKLGNPMLEPLASRVVDNAGTTHYRLEYTVQTPDGEKTQRNIRVSHFWVKTEDGWKLFGGATTAE